MDLSEDMADDPHLQAIMYLETKRHGLAFAISYLHLEPQQQPQSHLGSSDSHLLPAGPQELPSATTCSSQDRQLESWGQSQPPPMQLSSELARLQWMTVLALTQIECGGHLAALAHLKAAVPGLKHVLRAGLGYEEVEQAKAALCDMLILQASICCMYIILLMTFTILSILSDAHLGWPRQSFHQAPWDRRPVCCEEKLQAHRL